MGKIGNIITNICKVLIILGLIVCIVGTVVCAVIPKDFMTITEVTSVKIDMDIAKITSSFTEEDAKTTADSINADSASSNVNIDGNSIDLVNATTEGTKVIMTGDEISASLDFDDITGALVVADIALVFMLVLLVFVGKVCKAFKNCQSPFEDRVIKSMRNVAFALIPWAFFSMIVDGVTRNLFSGNNNFSFSFNLSTVITIVIIFVLTYVFKYGAMLQQESDETL
jgi:hypothetical protein